jgi:hypothetical protein
MIAASRMNGSSTGWPGLTAFVAAQITTYATRKSPTRAKVYFQNAFMLPA